MGVEVCKGGVSGLGRAFEEWGLVKHKFGNEFNHPESCMKFTSRGDP